MSSISEELLFAMLYGCLLQRHTGSKSCNFRGPRMPLSWYEQVGTAKLQQKFTFFYQRAVGALTPHYPNMTFLPYPHRNLNLPVTLTADPAVL